MILKSSREKKKTAFHTQRQTCLYRIVGIVAAKRQYNSDIYTASVSHSRRAGLLIRAVKEFLSLFLSLSCTYVYTSTHKTCRPAYIPDRFLALYIMYEPYCQALTANVFFFFFSFYGSLVHTTILSN